MGKWKPKSTKRLDNKINTRGRREQNFQQKRRYVAYQRDNNGVDNSTRYNWDKMKYENKYLKSYKGWKDFNQADARLTKNKKGSMNSSYREDISKRKKKTGATTHNRDKNKFPSNQPKHKVIKEMDNWELMRLVRLGATRKKQIYSTSFSKGAARGDMVKAMKELEKRKALNSNPKIPQVRGRKPKQARRRNTFKALGITD